MSLIFEFPTSSERIADLHVKSRQVTYRGLYSDHHLDHELSGIALKQWQKRIEEYELMKDFLIVAKQGDDYLGFAYATTRMGEGVLLDNMHVHPEKKSAGIGTQLLSMVTEWARSKKLPLYLESYDYNQNAISFYERKGCVRISDYQETAPGGKQVKVIRFQMI